MKQQNRGRKPRREERLCEVKSKLYEKFHRPNQCYSLPTLWSTRSTLHNYQLWSTYARGSPCPEAVDEVPNQIARDDLLQVATLGISELIT